MLIPVGVAECAVAILHEGAVDTRVLAGHRTTAVGHEIVGRTV